MSNNLSFQLNEPFPYMAYGVNYEGQAYVSIQWVVDRLNEVVGPLNWRHEFFDVSENLNDFSVELLGRLSIWNEERQEWLERTNYGNDTMTIKKEQQYPTAQDRMDCKKSAVSDSLKKCAAWFGVASDVFKGFFEVIKPKKSDGSVNPLYDRLVVAHGIVDKYGNHKYGIPILPDSYRDHYKEKGWKGIFQSDITALFTGNRGTSGESGVHGQLHSGNSEPSSILPGEKHQGASDDNGTMNSSSGFNGGQRGGSTGGSARNNSSSNSGSGNNKPGPIRMKVLFAPKFNPDGSATFRARLENSKDVTVFASKELANEVKKIRPNVVVKTNGWIREDQLKVTLAKDCKIDIETAA
jgi:hypothetical protein